MYISKENLYVDIWALMVKMYEDCC